jgi:cystathionine beta-lyase family protein involved in aluminum resistance
MCNLTKQKADACLETVSSKPADHTYSYMKNAFFTKEIYDNDIRLDVNLDVLARIYADNILSSDKLNMNFAFVTDTLDKAKVFSKALRKKHPDYKEIKIQPYDDLFEVIGISNKIQMHLTDINKWNQLMWDFGYKYDCKLDGWYVGKD